MNPKEIKRISKFLSLILRHKPESVGVELDANGWTNVDTLLQKMNEANTKVDRALLNHVVANNPKQRFAFSKCGNRIRANQGHSVEIDLNYQTATPPEFLFHGTPDKVVAIIRVEGLKKMERHHVHLHADAATCTEVARRYGKPVLLKVLALQMNSEGHDFYVTDNSVWLTDCVPPEFIEFPEK